jgi:HD-GYP domain-containing protein (c-di-GMP phosphodiesterase class II)
MGYDADQLALLHRVEAFAHRLVVALVNLELFADGDPQAIDNLDRLLVDLREVIASSPHDALELRIQQHQVRFGSHALIGASLQAGRLVRLCNDRAISAIEFGTALERDELQRFLHLLADDHRRDAFQADRIAAILRAHGVDHVAVFLRAAGERPAASPGERGSQSRAIREYQALSDLLQDSHVAASRGQQIAIDRAAGLVEHTVSHMDRELSGLLTLALYDDIDSFTVGHSVRVTLLALQVASAAGSDRAGLLRVGTAALLHDIGKSRIPQQVLFKEGPLEGDEIAVMMEHARLGGEILIEHDDLDPAAIGAAFCHHMGPNGTGYPVPALPFEPSGISKLVRVADVFEALTSVRPYKAALSPVHAYALMHRMQNAFDPRWLRFFTKVIGLFPIGTRVELDDGTQGTAIRAGRHPHQPIVRIAAGTDEQRDFATGEEGRQIRAVVGAADRVEIPWHLLHPQGSGAGCGCHPGGMHRKTE